MSTQEGPLTVPQFVAMKSSGQKITVLTAYDYTMAALLDAAGVDALLVGDTLSMVVQGHPTTLTVTLDQMIYHAEMVGRAAKRALVIVDLPFPTCHLGTCKAVEAAGRILKETRCRAVKLEGGAEQAETIAAMVAAGIPVMAHCGLRPQTVHVLGGYKVQRDEKRLVSDAKAVEQAGAFAVVLECIPVEVARRISKELSIPTIGIGAGPGCDGQVLVVNDMLGITADHLPRFVKPYAGLARTIGEAAAQYIREVRDGTFPDATHSFK